MKLKIDYQSIIDVQQELDPNLHREVFMKASNDVVLRSIPKANTKLKRKWNIQMRQDDTFNWTLASSIDGSFSKRGGFINFSSASHGKPVIVIKLDGHSIPDKRFDFSFDSQIVSLSNNKKKRQVVINKKNKASGVDRKRPRVKILKKDAGAVLLNKAFYAKFKSGHEGIFRRKGRKLIELRTITLPSMFEQINYEQTILPDHFQQNMVKRYEHYLKIELKSMYSKRK